jgi:hypothetical protein
MAARGAAAPAKPKAAQAIEVGEDPRVGQSGLRRLAGQLGRCEVFGPGEEGRVYWAELGQKAERSGRYVGLHDEKSRKRERLTGGLPRIPG